MDVLKRIKQALIAGRVVFTEKASIELERDGLLEQDVVESIIFAVAIHKTIRSTSSRRGAGREILRVIIAPNLNGEVIYSKGKLITQAGVERYYVLISAKRAE